MRDAQRGVRLRVGRNVRSLRRDRGWSQEKLAERVGNTYKHVGQIERGEVNVTIDILASIAAGLSVDVAALFAAASGEPSPRARTLAPRDLDAIDKAVKMLRRVSAAGRRRARPAE